VTNLRETADVSGVEEAAMDTELQPGDGVETHTRG
jgi:hypothetical protein